MWGFGFPFLFLYPGLTIIAPLWGTLAIFIGSQTMLKSYSNMNSVMLAFNYPLTILWLFYYNESSVYICIILVLIFNKVNISFFGSKVRQHFINPCFAKNQLKMRETLSDIMA